MSDDTNHQFCSICLEEEITEISNCFCKECNKHLCEDHTITHKKKQSTNNHTLQYFNSEPISLSALSQDVNPTEISFLSQQQHPIDHYCKEHLEYLTNIKCNTCQQLICLKCSLYKHRGHEQVLITDVIEKDKEEFITIINNSKEKLNKLTKRKVKVDDTMIEMDILIDETKSEINQQFNELKSTLEEKREKLLNEINNLQIFRKRKLISESTELEDNLIALRELKQSEYYSSLNVIDFEKEYLNLESFKNISKKRKKMALSNFTLFKFFSEKERVLNEIKNFGNVIDLNNILEDINQNISKDNNIFGYSNSFELIGSFSVSGVKDFVVDEKDNLIFVMSHNIVNNSEDINVYNLSGTLQNSFELLKDTDFTYLEHFCLDESNNTFVFLAKNLKPSSTLISSNNFGQFRSFCFNNDNKIDYILIRYSKTGDKLSQIVISNTFNNDDSVFLKAIDKTNGDLYICNSTTIYVCSKEGKIIKKIDKCLSCIGGVTINYDKNQLIVSDSKTHCVKFFTSVGTFITSFGSTNELQSPAQVTYDKVNKSYIVCDNFGSRMGYKFLMKLVAR
ncbi:hypothetical protein ABK040_009430 [Willaertia magna]